MRITRAAKVAAFPLIVLALVALVACQGGPGTKGDKGDKGDMGDMGLDGGHGANALVMIGTARLVINHDDEAGGPIALYKLFTGGRGNKIYEVSAATGIIGDDGVITGTGVTLEDISGGEQPLKVETVVILNNGAAFVPKTLMVTVTDGVGATAVSSIVLRRNRRPTAATINAPITIGLQDAAWTGGGNNADFDCARFNVCTIKISDAFMDEDMITNDDNSEKLTYTDDSDHVSVTAGEAFGQFVLKGEVATTDPVMVKVKATDEGGHEIETAAFLVNVNAPPAPKGTIGDVPLRIRVPLAERSLMFRFDPYFEDSDDLEYEVMEQENADKMIAIAMEVGTLTNEVKVTAIGPGTVTITVIATESAGGTGIGQSGKQEFEVTVTE